MLACLRVIGEELRDGQIERPRNLRQRIQRRNRVAVLHAREIAAQQARLLFDVSLGKPLLQPVSADGGADLQHGETPVRWPPAFTREVAIKRLLA
jgi:hypothetical protein